MNWVRVHRAHNSDPLWINLDKVSRITPDGDAAKPETRAWLKVDGEAILLKESFLAVQAHLINMGRVTETALPQDDLKNGDETT
jgi:hypothetical protein